MRGISMSNILNIGPEMLIIRIRLVSYTRCKNFVLESKENKNWGIFYVAQIVYLIIISHFQGLRNKIFYFYLSGIFKFGSL